MNKSAVIHYIVNWLSGYCRKQRMKGFVVGVSGGIDSALTSTLCAKTGLKTTVLNLPIYQSKSETDRAGEHIAWLREKFTNVISHKVDLTGIFQTVCHTLPKDVQDGLTMANTRARLRMLTLYAFAGSNRMLVAGTGNKVEDFGVGFFTKYGDGGVDISPVAGLMKSQVYSLAAELGIPESILKATPTDGLWFDSRSDESQIGASYDDLEWAMEHINSKSKKQNSKITKRQREVIKIFKEHHKKNRHKMIPIPVCKIPGKLMGK
ncbi:MAG: NAD(+) synthase [Bacteroidetes bacterium]|nr:NAD(+) synthase [Bacteroidota bacterium]